MCAWLLVLQWKPECLYPVPSSGRRTQREEKAKPGQKYQQLPGYESATPGKLTMIHPVRTVRYTIIVDTLHQPLD